MRKLARQVIEPGPAGSEATTDETLSPGHRDDHVSFILLIDNL